MRSIKYEKNLVKLLFKHKVDGKIETHYGSGVIVKPFESSKYLYIFTAKHTFEKEIRDEDYPDDKQKFLFDDEYIKSNLTIEMSTLCNDKPNRRTELYPSYIDNISKIIQVENKELDLLIFEISIGSRDVDICPLNISKNTFDKVVVAGFPSIRDGIVYGYDSSFGRYYDNGKIYVELKSKEPLSTKDINEYDAIKGMSGGGVFIEKQNQIYLVGVQIAYQAPNSFKCINLQTIYREINTILKSRTEVHMLPIDLDDGRCFDIEMIKIYFENRSIYVGKYPITYFQYDAFLVEKGSQRTSLYTSEEKYKYPAVNVSWNNVEKYCKWLSEKTNKEVRLLTSFDWNILVTKCIFNSNLKDYCICECDELQEIDILEDDSFGLNNIIGNICEWCYDGKDGKKYIKGIAYYDKLKDIQEILKEKKWFVNLQREII